MVARRMIPVRPLPPTVAQNSSDSSPSGVRWRICAVGSQQLHRPDVVAEAARAVVVLAVDVAGDRAADGDLPGARQHRHPQPERQRRLHQLIEADAGVDVGQAGVGVDRVDPVQRASCRSPGRRRSGRCRRRSGPARGRSRPGPPASATWATALAITSGSGVDSTCATDGAVRPKPVSRVGVVGISLLNIVKEGTACARSVQRSRKITERCTMKLITVAVPCAITKAAGTRHGSFANCR